MDGWLISVPYRGFRNLKLPLSSSALHLDSFSIAGTKRPSKSGSNELCPRRLLWMLSLRTLDKGPYDFRLQQSCAFKVRKIFSKHIWTYSLSKMSPSSITSASLFSSLSVSDDKDEDQERVSSLPSSPIYGSPLQNVRNLAGVTSESTAVNMVGGKDEMTDRRDVPKRKFCRRCYKAAVLCICRHIATVVNNKTLITILQHPKEMKHPLGTARIALLALQNVEVITIPEIDQSFSCRIRGKVLGSKRFIANRGGKKNLEMNEVTGKGNSLARPQVRTADSSEFPGEQVNLAQSDRQPMVWETVPPSIELQPGAGLLFPSREAVDLLPAYLDVTTCSGYTNSGQIDGGNTSSMGKTEKSVKNNPPSQLIVIDGTWSKARRIKFEHPWLNSLPHYRLPTVQLSRYGGLRREPKPGFLSTIESIVCALQVLEPETQNLETVLNVFDEMMEQQRIYKEEKCKQQILREWGSECI